jgi:hypothetical protein
MEEWLITDFVWLNTVMLLKYHYNVWFSVRLSKSNSSALVLTCTYNLSYYNSSHIKSESIETSTCLQTEQIQTSHLARASTRFGLHTIYLDRV